MSTRRLVYLIGQPGAGKSTVAKFLTAGLERINVDEPVPHRAFLKTDHTFAFAALGRDRASFGGTDTLAMNIQPKVLDWLRSPIAPKVVFGEGDRLGNAKFLEAMNHVDGWIVDTVYLDTPDGEASMRRRNRGSEQNEAWVRGRITKARKLADTLDAVRLDGMEQPQANADVLLKMMAVA